MALKDFKWFVYLSLNSLANTKINFFLLYIYIEIHLKSETISQLTQILERTKKELQVKVKTLYI